MAVEQVSLAQIAPEDRFDYFWSQRGEWVEEPNVRRGGESGVQRIHASGGQLLYAKRQVGHFYRSLRYPFGRPTVLRERDALLALPGLHPAHEVAALNLKATLAARTHRLELAVSLYQAILKRQPAHVEALSNLGLALQKLNRHEQALGFLKQAVQHRPGHAGWRLAGLWPHRVR